MYCIRYPEILYVKAGTYVTPGKIPTLEHEPGNDPMEAASLIAKPFLARTKSAEVLGSLRHDVTVELEDDSSRGTCAAQNVRAEQTFLVIWSGK